MLKRAESRSAARWLASVISLAVLPASLVHAGSGGEAGGVSELEFRVNGVPLRARAIRVALPLEALVSALLREWADTAAGPPLHVVTSGRTILGRQVGFLHETVTLKTVDAQHTEVHVAVRDLRQPLLPSPRLPFAVPRGFAPLSIVEQGAEVGQAQTISLSARGPVQSSVAALVAALRAAEWSVSPAFRAQPPDGVVLWASRKAQQMQLVVVPSGRGSTVIAQVSGHGR